MAPALGATDEPNRPRSAVTVDVTTYDPMLGTGTWWNENAYLRAEVWEQPEKMVVVSGNPAGLVSLARHALTLAQEAVPDGSHLDFDTYCGYLLEGSVAVRLEVEKPDP